MHSGDTNICFSLRSVADINTAISADLDDLKIWLDSHKVSLDVLNTQGICIGTCKRLQELKQKINTKSSFKSWIDKIN